MKPGIHELSRPEQIEEHMRIYRKLYDYAGTKGLHEHDGRWDGQEGYMHLPTQALATSILNLHFLGFMAPIRILGDES